MTQDAIGDEIVYPHPVWKVWRALPDPTALAQWLMPNDFHPRLGHRFTFHRDQEGGWKGIVECEVKEIIEPRRLTYTWRGRGLEMATTLVTFVLEPVGNGTRLRLEHTGFAAGGPKMQNFRDILDSGWATNVLRRKLPELLDLWIELTEGKDRP